MLKYCVTRGTTKPSTLKKGEYFGSSSSLSTFRKKKQAPRPPALYVDDDSTPSTSKVSVE